MESLPYPLITIDDLPALEDAMQRMRLWDSGEQIESVERAGEGNMNLVLRVETNGRSVIVKQSRPWVEKYPSIEAPADRALAEIDFYQRISSHPEVADSMPRLLSSDREYHLLALEDLGQASDYSDLYGPSQSASMPLDEATTWIANLHAIKLLPTECDQVGNFELRQLNHAHIFVIPFQTPSAIDLDAVCSGLEELAADLRCMSELVETAQQLGDRYLQTGEHLLHGDFYPGSWLRTEAGFRVIDPEFTYAGPVEFDLGVLAAHGVLIGGNAASVGDVSSAYRQAGGGEIDATLIGQFAGIEIIRRLIGVAQLPLDADIHKRQSMAKIAQHLLVP